MSNVQASTLIAAAIGATVGVVTAASIFIYQRLVRKQQYQMKNTNLDLINQRITELEEKLEAFRVQQKKKKKLLRRKHASNDNNTYTVTDNDTDIDTFSTAGTEFGDDEYFDCSDSESGTGELETRESKLMDCLANEIMAIEKYKAPGERGVEDVYYQLRNLVKAHSRSVVVVWRFARASYNYSNVIVSVNEKRRIITEGIKACEKIITFQDASLHKWYAILVGLNCKFLPMVERIKGGYCFQDHIIKAMQLRPKDADLHHLFGRFKYEVANSTWFEKKIAETFFRELSTASYEDAIKCFLLAEEFATKPNLQNQLFLSKSYIGLSQYEAAIPWLNKICDHSALTEDDREAQTEAKELLAKYIKYL